MVHRRPLHDVEEGEMKTNLDYLFKIDPPFIYVGVGELDRKNWNLSHFYSRDGFRSCVRRLRGKKMRTKAALMDEFAASFQFFDGFGENWHALRECLSYLDEWLPADVYVLVVEDAEEMLCNESEEQTAALLKTLNDVGEWWSKPINDNDRFNRPGMPFHVFLHVGEGKLRAIEHITRIAAETKVPVRL